MSAGMQSRSLSIVPGGVTIAMEQIYINALKQGGHRITEQRKAICNYLAQTKSHPTPYEVYEHVSQAHPDISRATVYNTLNALRDVGAIVEISVGGEHTHYETDPEPHVNLICLRCDKVVDYDGNVPMQRLYDLVRAETRFQPVAAQVQMFGFCRDCQERKRQEIREQLQKKEMAGDD